MPPPSEAMSGNKKRFRNDSNTATSSSSSKRQKRTSSSSSAKRKQNPNQQTLTQIDFVKSRRDHQDYSNISEASDHYVPPPFLKRNGQSRDSTLTQMDFFAQVNTRDSSDDDELLGPANEDPGDLSILPQYDGPSDGLRSRSRPHKQAAQSSASNDIQNQETNKNGQRRKRKNKQHMNARTTRDMQKNESNADAKKRRRSSSPRTPSRKSRRVDSSETPESIHQQRSANMLRQPLATISENINLSPSKTAESSKELRASRSKAISPSKVPSKKVCMLKHPVEQTLPRQRREQESQQTQWSVMPTSSPRLLFGSQRRAQEQTAHPPQHVSSSQTGSIETGQNSSQKSSDKPNVSTPKLGPIEKLQSQATHTQSTAVKPTQHRSKRSHKPAFGQTAGNDTQFVSDSNPHNCSPASKTPRIPKKGAVSKSIRPVLTSPVRPLSAHSNTTPKSPKASPLPVPRLVGRAVPNQDQMLLSKHADHGHQSLTGVRKVPGLFTEDTTTTQVMLDDILPPLPVTPKSSSGHNSALPASVSAIASMSRIASIPRPSQISTQALSTQGMDFAALSNQPDSPVTAIVIDSSSIVVSKTASQISPDTEYRDYAQHSLRRTATVSSNLELQHHATDLDRTQTPTQHSKKIGKDDVHHEVEDSPIIVAATTRAERDQQIERVSLDESSQLSNKDGQLLTFSELHQTPKNALRMSRRYSPIAGYNNDTQSDFTQGGHVSAAYIHRVREEGILPKDYIPPLFKPQRHATLDTSDLDSSEDDSL